jgi:hypothetical protein
MERFLFIAADNGILSMLSKIVPQRMVAINIHDRLSSERLALMFLVACHIAKGGLLNVIGRNQ